MKVGFPNNPRKNIMSEIMWIAESGFDYVEIFIEPDNDKLFTRDLIKKVNYMLDYFGLERMGHTACYLPIGSPFKELRDTSISIIKKQLEVFTELDCEKVVVHASWPPGLFTEEEGIKFQIESLQEIAAYAGQLKVKLLFESLNTLYDTKENIQKILAGNSEIEFLADIGHLNVFQRDPVEHVDYFQEKIGHIHLHDNDGSKDLHLPLGAGTINFSKLIEKLKSFYDGTITLEIFSPDKEYVLASKRKLQEEWNR